MAHHCRRTEIEAEKEQKGKLYENRWKLLEYKVMACNEERMVVCSIRREVQQIIKCWGCGKEGHCLWTCPKRVVHPVQGKAQQRKLRCVECREENHVAKDCDNYWRWRE